jgi:uncharacterized protein
MSSHQFIFDRLYGHIEITPEDLKLYQTKELARLRQISLSAIPPWIIPTSVCASRFEHSVGAAHLAKIVGKKNEFKDIAKNLYFAALTHDIGTPPFSHASEYFQVKLFKKNHEEFAEDMIADSEFAKEVKAQGGDMEKILRYITGKEAPISDLINGTIDVDNLDNTLRFGLSMGLLTEKLYDPEEMAKAYALKDDKLVLLKTHLSGLEGWEQTRIKVYDFIYSNANLATGMMLFRALDFAVRESQLTREYFWMTDTEAFNYLVNKCNPKTQTLLQRANRWIYYNQVYDYTTNDLPQNKMDYILNPDNRGLLADEIASQLKIPEEDVCVYMGRNKGFKQIHLPIISDTKEETTHKPQNKQTYHIQVYIHPNHTGHTESIKEIVDNKLA